MLYILTIGEVRWEEAFDKRGYNIEDSYVFWKDFRKEDPPPKKHLFSSVRYDIPLAINKEFMFAAFIGDVLIGMCSLFDKRYEHLKIGGIGKMAVNPEYRQNGVGREMRLYMINVMHREGFDISVLWASVLRVYEKVGYKAYYKNMMVLPIKKEVELCMILNLSKMVEEIGAW